METSDDITIYLKKQRHENNSPVYTGHMVLGGRQVEISHQGAYLKDTRNFGRILGREFSAQPETLSVVYETPTFSPEEKEALEDAIIGMIEQIE